MSVFFLTLFMLYLCLLVIVVGTVKCGSLCRFNFGLLLRTVGTILILGMELFHVDGCEDK